MIHGNADSGLANVLNHMDVCDYDFYVTGSRALGIESDSSDYDFFATWSFDLEGWLSNHNFEVLGDNALYPDGDKAQELRCVYRHRQYSIDVQLVFNASVKKDIQDKIAPILVANRHKPRVKVIWQTAYTVYRLVQKDIENKGKTTFYVGDKVEIISGAYRGRFGIIIEIVGSSFHVRSYSVSEWFDTDELKKV